jgi:two-component system response regulator
MELAVDGAAALARLFSADAARPDLVLLDLKLPLVDGLEILRRIRAEARTATIPVVVLTTSLEEHDLREAYRRGANSYLRKPVDFTQFVAMMRDALHYWLELNNLPSLRAEEAGDARE